MRHANRLLRSVGVIGMFASTACLAQQSVEQFYRGKQITLVIGYTSGGTYDLYARLVARHLSDHIPGHPTIIPENMPGAGSRSAATYVFAAAPKDGTVLGTADQSLALQKAVGDPTIKIDASLFQYIGNPIADNNTTATWFSSGIKTIHDAETKDVPLGATGGTASSQLPRAMNALLGTRFKIIYGYPGANDINLAMERGEVAGIGSDPWSAWKATRPDWVRDKKINILVQSGIEKASDLQDVPLLMDLGKNEADRKSLQLLGAPSAIGRPIFAPPGVPSDRIDALRQAFDATMIDPAFIQDAATAHASLNPVTGQKLQQIVSDIAATPKPLAERLGQIIGAVDAPPRK